MKTILVDAVNTFVVDGEVNSDMYTLLEKYPNKKAILTNADDAQMVEFGLQELPYEVFSLKHNPDKTNPMYFRQMLKYFNWGIDDVVYFEHNMNAVKSAESIGITSYHYDPKQKDLMSLKNFLDKNLLN